MTLLPEGFLPYPKIEASAYSLLRSYGRRYGVIQQPPVPVEKITEFCADLPIVYESIPDSDGKPVLAKLVVKRPQCEIWINDDQQRFFEEHGGTQEYTLAHELGHWMLHVDQAALQNELLPIGEERSVVLCRTTDGRQNPRERQAERFAAYLLMPEDLVRRVCTGVELLRWKTLYDLQKQFGVTITTFMRRMKELRMVEVLPDKRLVRYQDAHPSSSPSLWG